MRNRVLFEYLCSSLNLTIHFIMDQLSKHKVKVSTKNYINLASLSPVFDYPVGFFDGASTNRNGGIGVHLNLSKEHFYYLKMGCGRSTNTRSELLALWVQLVFTKFIGLPYLYIRGDSSAIIKWFNG